MKITYFFCFVMIPVCLSAHDWTPIDSLAGDSLTQFMVRKPPSDNAVVADWRPSVSDNGSGHKWNITIKQSVGLHAFPQQEEPPSVRNLITPKGIESVALVSKKNYPSFLNYKLSNNGNTGNTLCKYGTTSYDTELAIGKSNFEVLMGHHFREFNAFYYTSNPNYPNYSESNAIRSLSFGIRGKKYWRFKNAPEMSALLDTYFWYFDIEGEFNYYHKRKDNVQGLVSEYSYAPSSKSLNPINVAGTVGLNFMGTDLGMKYLFLNPFNPQFLDDLGSKPFANRTGGKFFFSFAKRIHLLKKAKIQFEADHSSSNVAISLGVKWNLTVPQFFPSVRDNQEAQYQVNTPRGMVTLSNVNRDPLITPVNWIKLWQNLSFFIGGSGKIEGAPYDLSCSVDHLDLSQAVGTYSVAGDKFLNVQNKVDSWGATLDFKIHTIGLGVRYAHIAKLEQSQFIGDDNFNEYAQIIPTEYRKDNFIFRLHYGNVVFNFMPKNYLKSDLPFYNRSLMWLSCEIPLSLTLTHETLPLPTN